MKYHDHFGRPLVAITGAGVVTSLGQGKYENWQKLTSGVSGIHKITRFPVEGLNTYIAGTIDFLEESTLGASALSEKLAHLSAEEALEQAALDKTNFNGPLFLAAPLLNLNGKHVLVLIKKKDSIMSLLMPIFLKSVSINPTRHFFETTQFGAIAENCKKRLAQKDFPSHFPQLVHLVQQQFN